jgi:3-dehydroquinate synthase
VDSGIGGKTGVNHRIGKNMIGAFKQPLRTIIDIDILRTLPRREFVAGYAELVKHGFIRNRALLEHLSLKTIDELASDSSHLEEAIRLSCLVKAEVVQEDEKESGLRAILNFGHTLGHVLETITEYKTMLHGEAVIVGMDFSAWWSFKKGVLPKEDFQIIHTHLKNLAITPEMRSTDREEFIEIIAHDKKAATQGIKFIGLTEIGAAAIYENTPAESLWESFQEYLTTDTFLKIIPS